MENILRFNYELHVDRHYNNIESSMYYVNTHQPWSLALKVGRVSIPTDIQATSFTEYNIVSISINKKVSL